ncbi:MAG: hypothetical protein NTU43_10885 [Bacteroidetes bacterium]|nr:hypothetical protein [Bacteroidota bacterium]
MKTTYTIKGFTLIIGITLLTSLFYTCKKGPIDNFKIGINATATTAPSTIKVYDVTTNTKIEVSGSLSVTITGKDAHKIYTPGGYQTFVVDQGQILISLRSGVNPTPENPFEFNINIAPDGYLPVIYPVTLTSTLPSDFSIGLVNLNNLPKGSTQTKVNPPVVIDTVTKKTTTPIVIKTDSIPPSGGTPPQVTTVTVPTGTQLQDKEGKPIELPKGDTTAKLTTQIVYFPPTEQALNSFPGGLETSTIQDTSGNEQKAGTLSPAGWVNIEMNIGNTEVKNFNTPIVVSMELDPNTINPNTEAPYEVGDSINIYSKSEGDENWILESVSAVFKNPNTGKLEIPMQVSHLSIWAAANFSVACGTIFKLTLSNDDTENPVNFVVKIYAPSTLNPLVKSASPLKNVTITVQPGATITTTNQFNNWKPVAGKKYFVQFDEPGNPIPLQIIGPTELCGNTPPTYTSNPAPNKMVFKVLIKCTNGNTVLIPAGTKIYFIDDNIYNNTLVGSGNFQHKVDPSDNIVNNPWNYVIADQRRIGGTDYNVITLPSTALTVGSSYRFSVYYDTGVGHGSREDKIFPEGGLPLTQEQLTSYRGHVTLMPVTLSGQCPF